MNKQLIIIRGPQGAGKSTLASVLAPQYQAEIYEADMYFINPSTGEYNWDASKIGAAHKWCQERVRSKLKEGRNVIVSNTSISKKELDVYLKIAEEEGASVWELIAWGKFQNTHGVPEEKVQEKRKAFFLNV